MRAEDFKLLYCDCEDFQREVHDGKVRAEIVRQVATVMSLGYCPWCWRRLKCKNPKKAEKPE